MKVLYPKHHEDYVKGLHYSEATHKYCVSCGDVFDIKYFLKLKNNSYKIGWHYNSYCNRCHSDNGILSKKKFKERNGVEYTKLSRRGLTSDDYFKIFNGKCFICGKMIKKSVIDHCHKSNHVRGILCYSCNLLIGLAYDNKEILQNAIKYLEDNGETVKRILGR